MKNSKLDKPLLFLMIVFSIFGLIMILSASSMASYMRYNNTIYYYFVRQIIFIIIGVIVFLVALYFPSKLFKKTSLTMTILITLSLFGLLIYGSDFNTTARSWYYLGPISIQPSELVKIFIILYLSNYYEKTRDNLDNQWILLKPVILCAIIFFLVAMQPDFGTAFIILLIVLAIFYVIPIKNNSRKMVTRLLVLAVLSILAYSVLTGGSFLRDYQLQRFNFLNPCERYQEESGYQLCNSLIAFKNGGLFGKGIGESTQKYLYLPEAHTDFIFPIIVEEWGLLVGILIIILYGYMIYRIIQISKKTYNLSNSILSFGIGIYFLSHIVINLLGVMGMAPLTGVPLPFLSYGGSYTIATFFAMGLLQRVCYENYLQSKKRKK